MRDSRRHIPGLIRTIRKIHRCKLSLAIIATELKRMTGTAPSCLRPWPLPVNRKSNLQTPGDASQNWKISHLLNTAIGAAA